MGIEQKLTVISANGYFWPSGSSESDTADVYIETQSDTVVLTVKQAKKFRKELDAAIKKAGNK